MTGRNELTALERLAAQRPARLAPYRSPYTGQEPLDRSGAIIRHAKLAARQNRAARAVRGIR